MKKAFFFSLLACVVFLGFGCSSTDPEAGDEASEGKYRKVTTQGTLEFFFDPSTLTTPGLLACHADGEVKMQWWFDEDGGEAIAQQSVVTVLDHDCDNFGTALPCPTDLADGQDTSLSFEAFARLLPSESVYTSGDTTILQDQLDFVVKTLPPSTALTLLQSCSTQSISDYGGSFNQLLLPFTTEQRSTSIEIGKVKVYSQEDFPATGGYLADINLTITEEWTDTLPR